MLPMTFLRFLFLFLALAATASLRAEQPNIILILADDMGTVTLGLPAQSIYARPTSTRWLNPEFSRTGLRLQPGVFSFAGRSLTGRDPRRFGYQGNLNKGDDAYPTRPELLGLLPANIPSEIISRTRDTPLP